MIYVSYTQWCDNQFSIAGIQFNGYNVRFTSLNAVVATSCEIEF